MESIITIIFSVISGILVLLISIIGYWLTKFIKSVDTLADIVSEIQIQMSGRNAGCDEKHISINARLKSIENHIDEIKTVQNKHDTAISILQSKTSDL